MQERTILAVDDSRTMRNMLDQTLSRNGFRVRLAEDGEDGLEKLAEETPDMVITDINMPRLDGFGFIEGVRSQNKYRGMPILVLSTESSQPMKERARDAGATGWIIKPFDEMLLVSAIRRVLA